MNATGRIKRDNGLCCTSPRLCSGINGRGEVGIHCLTCDTRLRTYGVPWRAHDLIARFERMKASGRAA